jgi:hypothetical protein
MRGFEKVRRNRNFPQTNVEYVRPSVNPTTPAILKVSSSPDEPPQEDLSQFQQNLLMDSDGDSGEGHKPKLPAELDWSQAQKRAATKHDQDRLAGLRRVQQEMARRQDEQDQAGRLRPPPPPPPGDPEVDIDLDLPQDAIVSVGVPKGRLPATKGLIRTIKSEFRQLRDKPESFWANFERELLSKYQKIAFSVGRRRAGAPPPVSHPFQIDDVTLLISLALVYQRRLPDASAARDGIPGEPGRDKTGAVEGVDIVNGTYDLGTTNRAQTGDTTYSAINVNPSFAFPKDTWRPGFNLSLEADINRSQRVIGDVKDAEKGSVEDARIGVEYLVYRPRWIVRVLNPNLTYSLVRPPAGQFPAPGHDEVLVLGVAQPYVQQARVEEVLDDAQAPRGAAPAIIQEDRYLREPKPTKLIKKERPDHAQLAPAVPPQPRRWGPDRRLSALPDHYYASGLTGLDKLYQHALGLLRRNNINDVDTASIITKVWTLGTNLHNSTRHGGGYRFPVFNKNAQIIALFEVNTTLFPAGFDGGDLELTHDDIGENAPRFTVALPPVELIGSVSDRVHIEDVATAIDGLSGGHTLAQSIAGGGGFSALVKKPGSSNVDVSAAVSAKLSTGNSNGVSTSRTSLWVHVSRFTGRTGAYSVPMVHEIRLIDPGSHYQPARSVPGVAMIRVPESEADRRGWPLELDSPLHANAEPDRGRPGNRKDFSGGAGMSLVRLDDNTPGRLLEMIEEALLTEGLIHRNDLGIQDPTLRNDGVRRHKQLENGIALIKLVSPAALRANYDQAHQGGYTFTLDVPAENVLPHVPSMPGVPGRVKSARVTIFATQSHDRADNSRIREPEFVRTTSDYSTVNLAMGMTTVGQSVGGSVSGKLGAKFNVVKDVLKSFGVIGGGYTYTKGANNEAKLLNNRPELLEYAHEAEEWHNYSDWHVQIEIQDAPILTRTLPPTRPLTVPRRLMHQRATIHTLDFINGYEKGVLPLNPDANLARRDRHFLENMVVYKVDAARLRHALTGLMRPFTGPANSADQAVRTLAGTTNVRASLKEVLRGGIFTELPFIPGWFKDKHGSAGITARMLNVRFEGTTRDSFTLGIIRLGLVSTSMGHNESHAWASDMFDFNLGAQVNTGDMSGGISPEHKQTWGTSKNTSREGAFERIQLKFGPAYKFRVGLRYRLETSVEYGGKFIPGNFVPRVTEGRPDASPDIAPSVLDAALNPGIPMRAPRRDLPGPTPDGAQVGLPQVPGQHVADGAEEGPNNQLYDVDSYAEFLVPERDALIGFVLDALPLTGPQLTDVMTRFNATQDGNPPPISGDLAAKVLLRWRELDPQAAIGNFAREVLNRHRDGDTKYYRISEERVVLALAALAPDVAPARLRDLPFQPPPYLVGGRPQDRVLGHSGITSVTYQKYNDGGDLVRHVSLYDTIKEVVNEIDPRALGYDVVMVGDQEQTRSKLKPIQGVSEGLSGVFGRGRDAMFIDDFLHDKGLTFALVHPTNWFNAEILEISVQMRLKDDYRWGDVVPVAGTENFTHGYTGQSSTVSKSDSLRFNGKFTGSRAPATHVGLGSARASVNNGYSRSQSTSTTTVSEQTVFDWGGHVALDVAHETIVTVRRYYMNERWLNNLSLALANRGNVLVEHNRSLHGTLSLEVPMSIATAHPPRERFAPMSQRPYVGKLPGDATVAGNTLDGLMPAAQRMLDRIQGKFWTVSNARKAVTEFVGITPFKTNPSAIMQSLLVRTQLNGHIPAAIGGGVHRLAEDMIISGNPDYLINVDLFGELIRHDPDPERLPEVLLEMTGNGSGRYNKFISSTNHSFKIDNVKGSLGLDAGYNYNRDVRAPDAKDPRVDQVVGGGFENTRAITTGTSASESRGRRDEQHIKQLVNRAADPNDEDGAFEAMYSVRFTGRFRLTANVKNRTLLAGDRPWSETFRTNWVEGYVYVTLTKAQYVEMMNTDYHTPEHFQRELDAPSVDPNPPETRDTDDRFRPPGAMPREFVRPAPWQPIAPNRLGLHGANVPPRQPHPQQSGRAPIVVPLPTPPVPPLSNVNMGWNPVPPIPPQGAAPPPPAFHLPFPYASRNQAPITFDPTAPPPPIVAPGFGERLQFDPLAPLPNTFGPFAPPPAMYPGYGQGPPEFGSPPDSMIFDPHTRPQGDPGQLDRMRAFLNEGGPSALADRLTAELERYSDAGILDHFAHLPNQGAADLTLTEVMRRTAHFTHLDAVRNTLQAFDRADMMRRFHERSDTDAAARSFVEDFRQGLDRALQGFYIQRGQGSQSPQRSLTPIAEEAEDDFYMPEHLHTGRVPFDRNSSDELRSTAGRTPWRTEQLRIHVTPPSSPTVHTDSLELLNRPPAGQDAEPTFLGLEQSPPVTPEERQLPSQHQQRRRVLERVRTRRGLARPSRPDQVRFYQLALDGVAGVLDNLPNRNLADRFMAELILHDQNLAEEFNRIAPDQVERLFANGTTRRARDIIRLLEEIRRRPYPVHEQRDIWAYVESVLS